MCSAASRSASTSDGIDVLVRGRDLVASDLERRVLRAGERLRVPAHGRIALAAHVGEHAPHLLLDGQVRAEDRGVLRAGSPPAAPSRPAAGVAAACGGLLRRRARFSREVLLHRRCALARAHRAGTRACALRRRAPTCAPAAPGCARRTAPRVASSSNRNSGMRRPEESHQPLDASAGEPITSADMSRHCSSVSRAMKSTFTSTAVSAAPRGSPRPSPSSSQSARSMSHCSALSITSAIPSPLSRRALAEQRAIDLRDVVLVQHEVRDVARHERRRRRIDDAARRAAPAPARTAGARRPARRSRRGRRSACPARSQRVSTRMSGVVAPR